jgi:hypothetical protein
LGRNCKYAQNSTGKIYCLLSGEYGMLVCYIARPITGCSFPETVTYYLSTCRRLKACGATVLHPLTGKESLRNEIKFKSQGYEGIPCSSNHAILQRDLWMVEKSDIVFMNLECANARNEVSIGCVGELIAGHIHRKHTVLVMDTSLDENGNPVNIHNHAFVVEAADIIFSTYEDGITYLEQLIKDHEDRYPFSQPPFHEVDMDKGTIKKL